MPINPVILFTERMEILEKDFLSNFDPKKILGKYNKCFNVGFLTIIISCENNEIFKKLNGYYNLNSKIPKFSSVILIKIEISEETDLERDFTWLKNIQGIKKGKDNYNSTIYKYENTIFIKSESSHFLRIIAPCIEDIFTSLSIITKIIEGIIIDQYIGAGYLPVHSCLVKNNSEYKLILGNSQSGKTTFAQNLIEKNFSIISDEITFISNKDIVGFGQYIKEYSTEKNKSNSNIEQYNNVYRKVTKLVENDSSFKEINQIYLMGLSKNPTFSQKVDKFNDKMQIMIKYLHLFPNEYFIDKDISYTLIVEVAKRLANIEVIIVKNQYDYKKQL
ncbi:hypothetical protein ACIQZG_15955 [Lysinibacillus sp. NPDC096418]|uniref:hypothetical protein n=1 Tax=Lysinibacillus sp. NPDC096418 TaxID=3364138 RepID=UPI0038210CE5